MILLADNGCLEGTPARGGRIRPSEERAVRSSGRCTDWWIRPLALALLLLLFCLPGQCQEAPTLTLDQAVARSLEQASTYQQTAIDETIASLEIPIAHAALGPRLGLAPGVVYNSPAIGVSPATPSFLGLNAILETQGLVTLSGDIDTSGKLHAALAKSQALLRQASQNTEAARRALAQSTEEAYFALSLAQDQRRDASQNVKDAEDFESLTVLRWQGGEVPAVDRDRAMLQTQARQDALRQSRKAEEVARVNLGFLVGWSGDIELVVSDLMGDLGATFEGQSVRQSDARPEIAALDAQIEASKLDAEIASAELRPQLSYSVGAGFITDSLAPQNLAQHAGIQVGIQLQIPLSDGGASAARRRQAELAGEKLVNQERLLKRQFDQQFETARAEAQSAWLRILGARASLDLAANVVSVATARYHAGEALINEVTDAQSTLVTVRQSLAQAAYDYKVALSRLRLAAGLTLEGTRQ